MSFGDWLRTQRSYEGLSQNALARATGVDPAYINRIERGASKGMVSRRVALSLARALNLSDEETDLLLWQAGLAPTIDWQTRAQLAEHRLTQIREFLSDELP